MKIEEILEIIEESQKIYFGVNESNLDIAEKIAELMKNKKVYIVQSILESKNQNIYITNSEPLKEGWYFNNSIGVNNPVFVENGDVKGLKELYGNNPLHLKKIILTTDAQLIGDGIQSIEYKVVELK